MARFQLFMIGSIRDYILMAEGAADESIEAEEMDDKLENEVSDIVIMCHCLGMLDWMKYLSDIVITCRSVGMRA